MRRAWGVAAVVALVAGAAVAAAVLARGDDTSENTTASSGPARHIAATTSTTLSPTSSTVPATSREPVTLAFGGDVHFEGSLRSRAIADPAGLLAPITPVLSRADVAMVNLETAVTDRGTPVAKEFVFRAPVAGLRALRAAGVDVATMANNHGVDYGPVGLADSLAAGTATGLPLVGIGQTAAAAYAPWRTVVRGVRIAVIGATQVIDDNVLVEWTATPTHAGLASAKTIGPMLDAIRAARATTDLLVVYVHWGVEGATCPTPLQKTLARQLVDAGADVVVGGHSHRVEGAGRLGEGYVAYGLGNFVFYNESGEAGVSGVLELTVVGRHVDRARWLPAAIRSGVPRPLIGSAADAAVAQWNGRRSCTDLTP
jgi:poly-gamma-glutamate synthesis protein (capsule biosynthesis protein)